jgi:hypothetical protein
MLPVISALLALVASLCRSRSSLSLENLALRHQLTVYKQTVQRPSLRPTDRLFWAWLSRLWRGWHDALMFVQPRTVIAWQQQHAGTRQQDGDPRSGRHHEGHAANDPTGAECGRGDHQAARMSRDLSAHEAPRHGAHADEGRLGA